MSATPHFITLLGIAIPASILAESEPADTLSLQEVFVTANFQRHDRSSLNMRTLSPSDVSLHASASTYVEMFQSTPGVYATASTGSYGDATLNIRGFKQDNIAILLNGIPIQGLTSGSMYWSNWMGLQDATYAVQIQKGMGASMLTDCAMGGAVNILTRRSTAQPAASFGLTTSSFGLTKGTVSYSSGLLPGQWTIDATASYALGQGYVECTGVNVFSYMLSLSKQLPGGHTLVLTALGSPEQHDQRNTELSADEVSRYGRTYSKNWGSLRGRSYSIGRNHYFKPYFTLQHLYGGDRWQLKNSLYLALADGGGRSTYAAPGATSIISHLTADGHIDFASVLAENAATGISQNVILDYLSGHIQAGAIASADCQLTSRCTLSAALQYQYYDTWSKMRILDLLGGDVFQLYGQSYLRGDLIGSSYGRTTHHGSGYIEGRYHGTRLNANLGAALFSGSYSRHNDLTHQRSQWAHGWGTSLRGGVSWLLAPCHTLYANAGFNSRLPYASTYLASSDLKITHHIVNEKNLTAEFGWRPRWQGGSLEVSAYIASWRDRTLTVSALNRANADKENYLVSGMGALHMGVEVSVEHHFRPWLSASAYAMVASWRWQGRGDAHVYDKYTGDDLGGYTVYCDGLRVGDAPQTQLGAQLQITLLHGFALHLTGQYNARMYADFEPRNRTNPDDHAQAYRLPGYFLVDAHFGWEGEVFHGVRLALFAVGRNLSDCSYIERGTDGSAHDRDTFRGYWGQGRTVSLGLRLSY